MSGGGGGRVRGGRGRKGERREEGRGGRVRGGRKEEDEG